jgi:hypothetical protein
VSGDSRTAYQVTILKALIEVECINTTHIKNYLWETGLKNNRKFNSEKKHLLERKLIANVISNDDRERLLKITDLGRKILEQYKESNELVIPTDLTIQHTYFYLNLRKHNNQPTIKRIKISSFRNPSETYKKEWTFKTARSSQIIFYEMTSTDMDYELITRDPDYMHYIIEIPNGESSIKVSSEHYDSKDIRSETHHVLFDTKFMDIYLSTHHSKRIRCEPYIIITNPTETPTFKHFDQTSPSEDIYHIRLSDLKADTIICVYWKAPDVIAI